MCGVCVCASVHMFNCIMGEHLGFLLEDVNVAGTPIETGVLAVMVS